jgi:multicopper oxidase
VVLNTATLSPAPEVTLPPTAPDQVIDAHLTGPVNGYTWPIKVAVKPKQRLRMRFINESMMFHPFHLHGHTFQVMAADARSRGAATNVPKARTDTVLVPPMQTVEVDFDTDGPGRWITHCHNTYHPETGMAFFVEYVG